MVVNDNKKHHSTGADLHDLFREVFHLQASLALSIDAVHEQSGMRTSHKRVAEMLARQNTATVPDIAAGLNVSRQFVQTVCNELNTQELLEFKPNPRHKRSKLAALTDKGRAVLNHTRELENEIIEELLPDLDAEAVGKATALLRKLRERVGSYTHRA